MNCLTLTRLRVPDRKDDTLRNLASPNGDRPTIDPVVARRSPVVGRLAAIGAFLGLAGALYCAVAPAAPTAAQGGKTYAFVVKSWRTGLYESRFMDECPAGLNPGSDELWWRGLSKADRVTKTNNGMTEILDRWRWSIHRGPHGEDVCLNPTVVKDPPLKIAKGKISYGVNLDGTTDGHATDKTCAHEKFPTSPDGATAVDNQMFRLLGCVEGWRWSFGQVEAGAQEGRRTSGLGMILMEVMGVDNLQNSDHVTVNFYRSIDQFVPDSKGNAIPFSSYRIDMDGNKPRYGSSVKGSIKNGVLTTEPGDIKIPFYGNYNYMSQTIQDARLHFKLAPDGSEADGEMAGYYPVDQIMRYVQNLSAVAATAQDSCPAIYVAAHELADGHKNPQTGNCDSLSTTLLFEAVGAYAIHPDASGQFKEAKADVQ